MTTAQESPNGRYAPPPPCPVPAPQDPTRGKDSTDDHNPNSAALPAAPETTTFPASAYHVPPELFAPKADSFRDPIPEGLTTMKLPDRCQFMFSDGRQCAMARSDIHPSLCTYHSDREEQLFGDPAQSFISSKLDLLELSAACRDLTTAAGVSRALAVVFRLLAQRRISRQEAATFAKLGQLLLRSLSAARADAACEDQQRALSLLAPSNGQRSALSTYRAPSAHVSSGHSPVSHAPERPAAVPAAPTNPSMASVKPSSIAETSPARSKAEASTSAEFAFEGAAVPNSENARKIESNSRTVNTCANRAGNPRRISRSENAGVEPNQNQHLQKNGGHVPVKLASSSLAGGDRI